jgi:hypothetical protein
MYVNIVRLDPDLLAKNAKIKAQAARARSMALSRVAADITASTALSGTIYNGHNAVTAQVVPGTSGTVNLTFDMVVPSISSSTFAVYRKELRSRILEKPAKESKIAESAGIVHPPPPKPASRMAYYALELLSDVLFHGADIENQNRKFNAEDFTNPRCTTMLTAMRDLDVVEIKFSGTLSASSTIPSQTKVSAYIPTTSIVFDDQLTIPFAGYSDNVIVQEPESNHLKEIKLANPEKFWTDPQCQKGQTV